MPDSQAVASPANPVSPEDLEAEMEAHLELFVRAVKQPPRFHGRPQVVPIAGSPNRFGLVDPSTIDGNNPRQWQASNARTGLATKLNPHGDQPVTRPIVGKPYPKSSPLHKTFTAEEIEAMQSSIDPDASGLTVADQLSEGIYSQIVKGAEEHGVPAGARMTFVVRFVVQRIDLDVYGRQDSDAAKAAYLTSHVKHAVAAAKFKEELFAAYEKRIAEATSAASEASEADERARISDLEKIVAGMQAEFATVRARLAGK